MTLPIDKKLTFYCSWTTDIYQFPTIYFELDGVELALLPKNLFYKEYDTDLGPETFDYIARFEFTSYYSFWTIGQSVLREYDMIFDMDENSVGFWNISKEPEKFDYLYIKIIGIVSVIIVATIIIYFIVLYLMKCKKEKENEKEKEKLLAKVEKMQEIASIESQKIH